MLLRFVCARRDGGRVVVSNYLSSLLVTVEEEDPGRVTYRDCDAAMARRGRPKANHKTSEDMIPNSDKIINNDEANSHLVNQDGEQKQSEPTQDMDEVTLNQLEDEVEERMNREIQDEKKSYAEAVGNPEIVDCSLSFIEAENLNGVRIAKLTSEDIIEECTYWDAAALVYVLGANPPLSVMEGYIGRIWKAYQIEEINFLKPGQYVVRFQKENERDEAIDKKFYHFDNKPVCVRKWKPGCSVDLNELEDISIWIQFPDLEIKYWSLSGLSRLGSLLGKPIRTDRATAKRTKLDFARMMVAVKMKQEFPESIIFQDENERLITQHIKYEWCPVHCSSCKGLGHKAIECRKQTVNGQKKTKMVWRPKSTQPNMEEKKDDHIENENLKEVTLLDTPVSQTTTEKVDILRTELHETQKKLKDNLLDEGLITKEKTITREYHLKLKALTLMRRQQTKMEWISESDQCWNTGLRLCRTKPCSFYDSNKKKKRKLQLHGSMLRKKKKEQETHPKFPNFESKNAAATSRNIRKALQRKFGVGMLMLPYVLGIHRIKRLAIP
ncbi:unnamed protein product [Cuscuta campestris]|uniref:DUF4283 domain-containing protein n=1 Tax=Cuscuta campestris TaxID=132261 RepID=A0A484LU71_9ASTE|nr:unnamed protein product [Cuscuta campestris]